MTYKIKAKLAHFESAKAKNKEIVADLRNKVAKSKSIIFTYYHGLTANNLNDLRSKLKAAGAETSIAKNTLLKIALKEEKQLMDEIEKGLKGPTATIFSYDDPVASIKALVEFAKKLELPKIKFALVEGRFMDEKEVAVLSTLPSKDVLISQIVRSMKSPLSSLINVMSGNKKKLVYALSAIAKKKEEV